MLLRHHSKVKTTEVKGHFKCFDNPSKKVILKEETIAECLVVSSHVLTLKHEVEQQLIGWKWLFVCFLKQLKEPLLAY